MKNHSISIRLADEPYCKITALEKISGHNKSQIIHDLIMDSPPALLVDHSREILPHLCEILTLIDEDETAQANQIRKEVSAICQFLKK